MRCFRYAIEAFVEMEDAISTIAYGMFLHRIIVILREIMNTLLSIYIYNFVV